MSAKEREPEDCVAKCACCGEEVGVEGITRCPRCKREVCDDCFLISDTGGMCESCAVKSEEGEDADVEEDDSDRREEFDWDDDEEEDEEEDEDED